MNAETVVLTVLAVSTAINAYYSHQDKKEAAVKVEEVKTTLENSTHDTRVALKGLQNTADDTHVLVNNNMAIQLSLNAVLARRMAAMTGDKGDELAALTAENALAEHERKQAEVDQTVGVRRDIATAAAAAAAAPKEPKDK